MSLHICSVRCLHNSQPQSPSPVSHLQTPQAITPNATPHMYTTCFGALLPVLLVHFCWSTEQLVYKSATLLQSCPLLIALVLQQHTWMQALIAPALALFRCYREGTIYLRLFETDNRIWSSPYNYVMAILVVTIKVLYGLDGVPRPAPLGLPGAPHWTQWAESALQHLQGPVYPEAHEQVSDMTNAELLQYKRYLQKYVFAGWQAPDDLKEWVRLLERHILHADMQAEEEQETMTDGDTDVGHPAAKGDPRQPASSAVDEHHETVPTEETKHPYLFTGETRSRLTRDKVAPDYAAVLTVCSRYLWITPIQLHAEVAQLEYEMAEVEASASSN
ncbi:TPA: hypothetical protein ACH3X1_005353 [Trebouxia sp. C0004]